ncbi:MAG: hypothetical protein A4E27_01290 [Methanobacterium sp. PtaU1.Bin242]|nr:MAG: hypothetical protein A4E27_01290 [Methanobacterium sp. PtaU1.Bin242]
MTPKNKQESALGKGLDALIRRDYLDEEEKKQEAKVEAEEKVQKSIEEQTKATESTEKSQDIEKKGGEKTVTEVNKSHDLSFDNKIVEDVLLEVHKNPRISLWSAKSAAVLRFLKKTKPEFSISNEASILIEAAVKERHPDIWQVFEEKGL